MRISIFEINEKDAAVFDADTLRIWRLPLSSARELPDAPDRLEALLGQPVNAPTLVPEQEVVKSDCFDTLVLHIANCCNMQCEYCYESHSTYISAPGNMSIQTAIHALEKFYSEYAYIREIKLFGGEPALNQPVIRAVCEYIDQRLASGQLQKKPVFKIITNGTIMNPEFIDLIQRYQIKVVFSIDGDASMHDALRVYPGQKDTFDTIYKNFFLLREATDGRQPYSINATFTGIHEKLGLSVNDVLWRLSDLFPVEPKKINVHLVTADASLPYSIQGKDVMLRSAEDALSRAENGDTRTHTRLKAVIRRLRKGGVLTESPCPAAVTWAAVSHTGSVYPCMMFIDRQDCYMGNVNEDPLKNEDYRKVSERFGAIQKSSFPRCRNCLANRVCASCMGINEFETGGIFPRSERSCLEYRRIVEIAVKGIAEGVW